MDSITEIESLNIAAFSKDPFLPKGVLMQCSLPLISLILAKDVGLEQGNFVYVVPTGVRVHCMLQ
jgi:hypothetical protein